jgi:hypothetical protein
MGTGVGDVGDDKINANEIVHGDVNLRLINCSHYRRKCHVQRDNLDRIYSFKMLLNSLFRAIVYLFLNGAIIMEDCIKMR